MKRSQPTPAFTGSCLAQARRAWLRPRSFSVIVGATLASLALSASTAHAADCAGANLLPALASVPTAKTATVCLLNHERSARGLLPLAAEPELESAAGSYAQAMVGGRFFSHVSPGGQTIADRLATYVGSGQQSETGEIIAWGVNTLATPSSIVKGWMASDGHRENILGERFEDIGVGIAGGTPSGGLPAVSATYVTMFGSRAGGSSAPTPVRASASSAPTPVRASASSAPTPIRASASSAAPVPAGTAKQRVSAKKRQQISKRCRRIARRTKGSKKMRAQRYSRCMRKELRVAAR